MTRRFIPQFRLALACTALWICAALPVFADGKFFRRVDVADEPGIVAQRAVVAFKDGVETLIVQSDVQGDDSTFGWILPLPAEPTSIAPCPPSSLNVLNQIIRPRIAVSPKSILILSVLAAMAVIAVCASHLRERRHPMRTSPFRIALGVAVALVVVMMFLPTLGHRISARTAEVLQNARAGIYDVTVIRGDTAEEITHWLNTNGFAYPPSAASVIEEYVSQDWCFLAARIAQDAAGEVTHHPLKVAFAAAEAVYPMKLTGSDGEPVQLDLYVIGEEQASVGGMRVWHCDTYYPRDLENPFREYVGHRPAVYSPGGSPVVGIPAVSSLMWPGCTLTRLRGRLSASDMARDVTFQWSAPKPFRATLFNQARAIGWSACITAVALAVSFALFTWSASRRGWTWQVTRRRGMPAAAGIAVALGAAFYLWVDVVPFSFYYWSADAMRMARSRSVHRDVLDSLSQAPADAPFPDAYRGQLANMHSDRWVAETDDPVNPGDYRIDETDEGWLLTIIDSYHVPITIPISSNGVPQAASERP